MRLLHFRPLALMAESCPASITLLLSSSSHLHVVVLMKEDRALVHVFFCCFGEETFSVLWVGNIFVSVLNPSLSKRISGQT